MIIVPCNGVVSAAELWDRYVAAAFPAGAPLFGRNLNAFWDAVEHDGPGSPGKRNIVFEGKASLACLRMYGGESLLEKLEEIARDATRVRIVFR